MLDLVIRAVIRMIKEANKSKSPQYPTEPVADTPERSLRREVWQVSSRLPQIEQLARKRLADLEEHQTDLKNRLAPILRDGVLAQAQALGEQRDWLMSTIENHGAQASLEHAQRFVNEIQGLQIVLQVMKEILKQRSNERDRAVLGDADALASACYTPVLDFAHNHQLPITSNQPMTLFHPGGTFIELAFIKQKLAPIGLPENYRTEPWWWPAIAHEIAHDFYASLPGLEPELIDLLDLDSTQTGSITIGTETFNRYLYRIWVEEIFADAVGALMIGPAYLKAMIAIFRNPDAPKNVLTLPISNDGQIDVHPPRHLRVHITGSFLHRQGFSGEVREMVRSWDQEHGQPEELTIGMRHQQQSVALAPLISLGESIADQLYNAQLQSLASHRLADVPGLSGRSSPATAAARATPAGSGARPGDAGRATGRTTRSSLPTKRRPSSPKRRPSPGSTRT